MLKLNKSLPTQTLAVYLNTTESLSDLVFVYSQSYDLSNGTIDFPVSQTKGQYRIGTISGSSVPSPSGQYNIDIYKGSEIPAVWNQVAVAWNAFDEVWSTAGTFGPTGSLLRTIRATVSGSNDVSFTEYVSPNELGTYTTYNG